MCLEILDESFGSSAAVDIREHKLVLNFPVFFY